MSAKHKRRYPKPLKVAATVIVHDGAKMTMKGRRQIAKWLRGRADLLIKHGDLLSPVFRARYYYSG